MRFRGAALLMLLLAAAAPARGAESLLSRGNQAFREGSFEEAARLYESTESREAFWTRKFNAGVARLQTGEIEQALARFEEVSARAEPELRARAFYNLGYCQFQKGKALEKAAAGLEESKARLEKLVEAAKAYRAGGDFFRKVEPPLEDADHNIAVSKVALRAVLDEIRRLEEEEKRRADDEALKDPASLLATLVAREKLHRRYARALEKEGGRAVRLGSRQLRKAEAENRVLAEKLHHLLGREPGDEEKQQLGEAESQAREEARERAARAAEPLGRAIAAQREAELAYLHQDPARAAAHHAAAVTELRAARSFFPGDLPALLQEGIAGQEAIIGSAEALTQAEGGGLPEGGGGLGKAIVEALKDKVLKPVARLLQPGREDEIKELAGEEEDVVWVAELLSRAELSAPAAQAAGHGAAPPGGQEDAGLDPEQLQALNEAVRREGEAARVAAVEAREALAAAKLDTALPAAREALAALRRLEEVLPKPPEPLEARLAKLIERQKGAQLAAGGLDELEGEARSSASAELASLQRAEGVEAEEIGKELEARQGDERAQEAAAKVHSGAFKVFASEESLTRRQARQAEESIEQAVKDLEEALALLSGKDEQGEDRRGEDQGQDQQQQQQQQQGPQQQQEPKGAYALTPREARMKREEMDRKRREEEAKLFAAPSSITVEKDW
jgi:hypothetical protein